MLFATTQPHTLAAATGNRPGIGSAITAADPTAAALTMAVVAAATT